MSDLSLQLAVPMTCESCASDIKAALKPLNVDVDCDVEKDLVVVRGDVAPSSVVSAITGTGRDAIVRGTGAPNSAAVCILEDSKGRPHGLVRIIQLQQTIFDLSISSDLFDTWGSKLTLTAHKYGDISQGAKSVGEVTDNILEISSPDTTAYARAKIGVSGLIGRSLVLGNGKDGLVGIVARSAGVWELDKTVCSCTGKTMWQEARLA